MDRTEGTLGEKGVASNTGSDRIRDDIRGTRRTMDQTLDQLGERLRPRHLFEDLLDAVFGAQPGEGGHEAKDRIIDVSQRVGGSVLRYVRENPAPSLLIGAGIVWWLMESGARESAGRLSERAGEAGEGIRERAGDAAAGAKERASQMATSAGEKLSQAGSAVQAAAASAWERARGQGRTAMDRGTELGQTASDYARRGAEMTREGWIRSRRQIGETAERYPLAVGGACLAAGILAGVLLPRTQREDELLGEASDRLREGATTGAQELLERGKEAAARTAESAMGAAEQRGLSPESIVEKAKTVVVEAASAAKRSAQEQGLAPDELKATAKEVAQAAGETAKSEGKRAGETVKAKSST